MQGIMDLAAIPREFPQFGKSAKNIMMPRGVVFGGVREQCCSADERDSDRGCGCGCSGGCAGPARCGGDCCAGDRVTFGGRSAWSRSTQGGGRPDLPYRGTGHEPHLETEIDNDCPDYCIRMAKECKECCDFARKWVDLAWEAGAYEDDVEMDIEYNRLRNSCKSEPGGSQSACDAADFCKANNKSCPGADCASWLGPRWRPLPPLPAPECSKSECFAELARVKRKCDAACFAGCGLGSAGAGPGYFPTFLICMSICQMTCTASEIALSLICERCTLP